MKNLIHIFNLSSNIKLKSIHAISTEILPIGRLKNSNQVLKNVKSIFPIPEIPTQFNKNFIDISLGVAEKLWINNKNLGLYWSGGIDSTFAAVCLLLTIPDDTTITVLCNMNSILENPNFYKILLKNNKVKLINSSLTVQPIKYSYITGDLGDQIFGSEIIFKISELFGFDVIHQEYQKIIPNYFNKVLGDEYGKKQYDIFIPIVEQAPFKITTTFDFLWWWNFSYKWQGVYFRKKCFLPDEQNIVHFFEDEEFQIWSMLNQHLKIGNSLNSYKQIMKDFIYQYDKNENYRLYKRKLGSPFSGVIQYFGEYEDGTKIKKLSDAIEELNQRVL